MMRIVAIFITFIAVLLAAANAYAGPLDYLDGRWAGWGRLHTKNGASQRLKCITTYKISNGGTKATQNFRCTSDGYRFSSVLNYTAKAGKLSGSWREQIYSAGGAVQGSSRPGNIKMTLQAETFTARASIMSSKCTQNIAVVLDDSIEIDRFDIKLRRC